MAINLDIHSFMNIAQTASQGVSGENSTIRAGAKESELVTGKWQRIGTRSAEFKQQNNTIRQQLMTALTNTFGGMTGIPKSVKDVLKLKDFGLDENGKVTSSKPLTARRITAIMTAVTNEVNNAHGAYGVATEISVNQNLYSENTMALVTNPKTAGSAEAKEKMAADNAACAKIARAFGDGFGADSLKATIRQRIMDFSVKQIGTQADVAASTSRIYTSFLKLGTAFIDTVKAEVAQGYDADSAIREPLTPLLDRLLDQCISGGWKKGYTPVDSDAKSRLDDLTSIVELKDSTGADELQAMMKSLEIRHTGSPESVCEALDKLLTDVIGKMKTGVCGGYLAARILSSARPKMALVQANPNDPTMAALARHISIDDFEKSPNIDAGLLEKWTTDSDYGLGEKATNISNTGQAIPALANDIGRSRYTFTIGEGANAVTVDKRSAVKDLGNEPKLIAHANDVVNAVKSYVGDIPKNQLIVLVQGLSQNGLGLSKAFGFPALEHAPGSFTVVKSGENILLSFKADTVVDKTGQSHNLSQSYEIHPDGTSKLVAFEKTISD